MRQLIIGMIISSGINPVEASNGRQALSLMKKYPIDVVISDLVMPKMSGMMLLHSMLEQGLHLPFIMTTGFSDKDSAVQALRLGAFDYLEKPLNPEDLQSVLGEALKVGHEQRKLLQVLRGGESPFTTPEDGSFAEVQIMKMRTLRFKVEPADYAVTRGTGRDWETLKNFFVSEAESQLIFCAASLQKLLDAEDGAHELGFALRVVQSVRMASEAVRVNDVAELAWSLEKALAAVKAAPGSLTQAHLNAMLAAAALLKEKVIALGSREVQDVQRQLDSISSEGDATPAAKKRLG